MKHMRIINYQRLDKYWKFKKITKYFKEGDDKVLIDDIDQYKIDDELIQNVLR